MGGHVFLIAGEASGDLLGARLMAAMKESNPHVRFSGVGGQLMAAEGLISLVPIEELALHGLVEVIKHIPNVLRRINDVVEVISSDLPDVLVTIDAPGFSLRVARKVKSLGVPLVHYVAPTVWAWRPGRAKKISRYLDHLLTLFDFEPSYFTKHGLKATFVGHPLTETQNLSNRNDSRVELGFSDDDKVLALLPGSRKSEVRRMLPFFEEVVHQFRDEIPDLKTVVPVVDYVKDDVVELTSTWENPPLLIDQTQGKFLVFAAADAALACSGTAAMELAWAKVPTVIGYKMAWLSSLIGYMLLKVKYASMINIIADRAIQPEFLQWRCKLETVVETIGPLLLDDQARQAQMRELEGITDRLRHPSQLPSQVAAEVILSYLPKP